MDRFFAAPLATLRTVCIAPLARCLPSWVTPTRLTLLRLVLVVPLAALLVTERWGLALAVYTVAVLTDAADGELARLRGTTSVLGARLDPSVDKVLHIIVSLVFLEAAPLLLATLIALDLLLFLAGLLVLMVRVQNSSLAGANVYGKWKFLVQAIGVLLIFSTRLAPGAGTSVLVPPFLTLAIIFAVLSMIGYLLRLVSPSWR